MRALRTSRRGELGLTLIEALVSVTILTIVAGAVALGFSVALRALASGGVGDRIAGTHDLSAFEQQLGGDVARGACISQSPASGAHSLGTCTQMLAGTPSACASSTTSFLCVAWPVWSEGASGACHTAVYSQSGNVITRVEYSGTTRVGTTHVTSDAVTATAALTTVASPSNPSKTWVSLVTVTLTSLGVASGSNPPSGTLLLHPMATDPTTASVTPIC